LRPFRRLQNCNHAVNDRFNRCPPWEFNFSVMIREAVTNQTASARQWLASMAKTKIKKCCRINNRFAFDVKMLTPSARPLKGGAVSLGTRTPAGHSGRRSESGARGQGLVTSAPGRLRQNARPA
jgi:hypothetical protein